MSKEFQRIKERADVRKQLSDFLAQSFSRAVSRSLLPCVSRQSRLIGSLDPIS